MWNCQLQKHFILFRMTIKKKKIMKMNVSCSERKSTSLIIVARVDRNFHSVSRTNESWILMLLKVWTRKIVLFVFEIGFFSSFFWCEKAMSIWFQNNFLNQRAFLEKKFCLNVCVAPNSLRYFPEREGKI